MEVDEIPVNDIEGIELYRGPATTPSQFWQGNLTECGTVVIWSRMPPRSRSETVRSRESLRERRQLHDDIGSSLGDQNRCWIHRCRAPYGNETSNGGDREQDDDRHEVRRQVHARDVEQ